MLVLKTSGGAGRDSPEDDTGDAWGGEIPQDPNGVPPVPSSGVGVPGGTAEAAAGERREAAARLGSSPGQEYAGHSLPEPSGRTRDGDQ